MKAGVYIGHYAYLLAILFLSAGYPQSNHKMPGGGINSFGSKQGSGKNYAKAWTGTCFAQPCTCITRWFRSTYMFDSKKSYFSVQHKLKLIVHGLICVWKVTKIATKQASRFGVLYISGMEIHICHDDFACGEFLPCSWFEFIAKFFLTRIKFSLRTIS